MGTSIQSLEPRILLSFDPTSREQESLELLNRIRTDPADELPLLINSNDADVNNAISFFHVDKTVLAQQWASLTAAQPLAWNEMLYDTARAHSQEMLDFDVQSHQLPGELELGDRITAAGYDFSAVGENVFASAKSPFHAHAGFAIDWGNAPDGIQNPPGHRENIMNISGDYREVGIGILDTTSGKSVGPQLITQDFGNRFNFGNSFLLGVVYDDANSNSTYNRGEGVAGAAIHITGTGGTFDTTSMTAGGYQIQLPAGTYTLTASGGSLTAPVEIDNVVVGSENVKEDFVQGATPNGPHVLAFDAKNKATYTDASGDTITVSLKGAGSGTISLSSGQSDASEIVIDGTTTGSKLKIKSTGPTTIGDVTVHGSLAQFVAATTDLAGDMTFDDSVKTLQLANIAGGRTLTINGTSLPLTAKFASLTDFTLTSVGMVASIKTSQWIDTADDDTLSAALIKKLQVAGDLNADITATDSLTSLKVGGAISGSEISATNTIGKVNAHSINASSFNAALISKIQTSGDFNADVTVTNSLTSLKAGGAITASDIRAANSIGKIAAGSIDGSTLFAGARADLDTLPATLSDFTNAASLIASVKTNSFSNTQIAAATIAKLKLGAIQTDNSGDPFGIAANTIASVKGQTSTQVLKLKNLDLPGDSVSEGDLLIQLL